MEFIFTKDAGSEDFQQEIIDILNVKYHDFDNFLFDIITFQNEIHLSREKKEGSFSISISKIDYRNEVFYIDWLGIG